MVSVDDLASVGHPQTLRASEASSHRRPRSLRYTRPRIHQSAAYSERRIQEHLAEAREILKLSSPSSEMREPAQSSLQACFGQCQVLQCDYFGRISMPLVATSLKLPKTLKSRITRLAKRAGESPHAFMLRLLEKQVQAVERFEQFVADARQT